LVSYLGVADALKIEIKKGEIQPDPIAVVNFVTKDGEASDDGTAISDIIRADLASSGLFLIVKPALFLETAKKLVLKGPNLKNWNVINARFLVYGDITSCSFGKLVVNFKLTDVVTKQAMFSLEVKGSRSKIREMAHIIGDHIYTRITNEKGYFNTKIYIVQTNKDKKSDERTAFITEIGQDGHGANVLTDGKHLVVTPRCMPDGRSIAFLQLPNLGDRDGAPRTEILNVYSKSTRHLISDSIIRKLKKENGGKTVQMAYAPRFSPDSTMAVLAIIIDGKSAIYKLDLTSNDLTQLTQHKCIDTSPCFTPDGEYIIFTSNRAGKEAIYKMEADGSNPIKISKGPGKYSQPMVSPRGDLIAFSYQRGGVFYVGTMRLDGSGENLILNGYMVEAPCWAANGRYIAASMTSNPGAKSQIVVVDITGHHVRMILTPGDAQYPAWGPLLDNQ
jgi:TolB protein